MSMLRIVVGRGLAKHYDLLMLAVAVAGEARRYGLGVLSVRSSRDPGSGSRYVSLRCHSGRRWLIRVSNHRRPEGYDHDVPHLDLVSIDGTAGLPEASRYLETIAQGSAHWFDPTAEAQRLAALKKKNARR